MEDFIMFKIVKKLEEKGFDLDTSEKFERNILACRYEDCRKPTIPQVLKWLREEKKMYIEPCILTDADTDADSKVINIYTYWSYSITHIESGDMIYYEYEHIDDKRFDSYEQAALAGIEYTINNLI
jgi:hypothetical protein